MIPACCRSPDRAAATVVMLSAATAPMTSRWHGDAPAINGAIWTDARTAIIATIVRVGNGMNGLVGAVNMCEW